MKDRAEPSPVARNAGDEAPGLSEALRAANIPTLLAVMTHLTGDRKWISPPFLPARTRGMEDNASGGLPDELRAQIVEAAQRILNDPAVATSCPSIDDDLLLDTMRACMGEDVPSEYLGMMREEMGLAPRFPEWDAGPVSEVLDSFSVLIVGAGASGLCLAIALARLGIPYEIIEKNPALGGTWFENRYPGCGVDTPSHLYSYSFARANWSRYFAQQAEIEEYLQRCAIRFGVVGNIMFNTSVEATRFDDATGTWTVMVRNADGTRTQRTVNVVVSAVGQLNVPFVPAITGQDEFQGLSVHSARWRPDIDPRGRRVAVIGSGATAMQLVPALAPEAAHVTVFQRSPQWAAPSENYQQEVPPGVRHLMKRVPAYSAWYRFRLAWSFSDKVYESLQIDPSWPHMDRSVNAINDAHRRFFTRHLMEQLGDREDLVKKVLPTYPPFAKRMLIDNDWFTTIKRSNVSIVDAGIDRITADGVVDYNGELHPVDMIAYATGFQSLHMVSTFDVFGRAGERLRDVWGDDDARAYLGITVPGFPNFYCLYGPNTSLGHGGSLIFLTECAVRYVVQILQRQIERDWISVDCRKDVFDDYNARVDAAHDHIIWSYPGVHNWYRNDRGRVVTNSPWRLVDYWAMTREPNFDEYVIVPRSGMP